MGNEQSMQLLQQLATTATKAADTITKTLFFIDSDDDALLIFNTQNQIYALSIVLQDSSDIGWRECKAISDCIGIAAAGTAINQLVFNQCAVALRERYGNVRGPETMDNGVQIMYINPPRGNLIEAPKQDCLQKMKIAADDNEISIKTLTNAKNCFIVRLSTPNHILTANICNTFVKVLTVMEPANLVNLSQFLAFAKVLEAESDQLKVRQGVVQSFTVTEIDLSTTNDTNSGKEIRTGSTISSSSSADSNPTRNATPFPGRPSPIPAPTPSISTTCPYKGYSYRKLLANSGQARVYAGVRDSDGTAVAIKVFHVDESVSLSDALDTYRVELKLLLKSSGHPNVVDIHTFFETPKPALVMELVDGENVNEFVEKKGKLGEKEAVKLAVGICEGLIHLHKLGIVHRDLKSPNVLRREDGTPVLIDLGLSSVSKLSVSKAAITGVVKGSPIWMAPEMIKNKQWSDRTDVYAFAMILWELLSGRLPFIEEISGNPMSAEYGQIMLLQKIVGGERPSLSHIQDNKLKKVISMCWHPDPNMRPSMKQVREMIKPSDARSVFKEFDENDDGSIDFTEFAILLRKHAPGKTTPAQTVSLFEKLDSSNSGKLEFKEFEKFWTRFQTEGIDPILNGKPTGRSAQAANASDISNNANLEDLLQGLQRLLSDQR